MAAILAYLKRGDRRQSRPAAGPLAGLPRDRRPARIVLVRHGATVAGEAGLVSGQSDLPLSPVGRQQAEAVAARFAHKAVGAIFVTPLRRTQDSAAPLARRLELEPAVLPELTEVHLGELERRLHSPREARAVVEEVVRRGSWDLGAGGETMEVFAARVASGLDVLTATASRAGGCTVAYVHGGVIAESCRQVTGSSALAFLPLLRHGSVTSFRATASGLTLETYNDTGHLRELLQTSEPRGHPQSTQATTTP